ncbi:hypothetical protein Hypma_003316 [Hypsizygus marmoreus]|uniref:Uncharacterized protein n=1 Tax=Hypsizygus marmoreus TaxID=39966 RepID=A0A369J2D2_HYPMA|nr:hypothetical protein Hypma_003316 [Hypsizygus marmoreus]
MSQYDSEHVHLDRNWSRFIEMKVHAELELRVGEYETLLNEQAGIKRVLRLTQKDAAKTSVRLGEVEEDLHHKIEELDDRALRHSQLLGQHSKELKMIKSASTPITQEQTGRVALGFAPVSAHHELQGHERQTSARLGNIVPVAECEYDQLLDTKQSKGSLCHPSQLINEGRPRCDASEQYSLNESIETFDEEDRLFLSSNDDRLPSGSLTLLEELQKAHDGKTHCTDFDRYPLMESMEISLLPSIIMAGSDGMTGIETPGEDGKIFLLGSNDGLFTSGSEDVQECNPICDLFPDELPTDYSYSGAVYESTVNKVLLCTVTDGNPTSTRIAAKAGLNWPCRRRRVSGDTSCSPPLSKRRSMSHW